MSTRLRQSLGLAWAGLNGSMALATLWFSFVSTMPLLELLGGSWQLGVSFSLVGAWIVVSRPHNLFGWINLFVGGTQSLVVFAYAYAEYTLVTAPGALPWGGPMSILGQTAWVPGVTVMLTYGLLLFPDGRLPSPRWRWLAWLSAAPVLITLVMIGAFWPYGGRQFHQDPNSVQPPGLEWTNQIAQILFPLLLFCGISSLVAVALRYRHAGGNERQQLKWFVYAAVVTIAGIILTNAFPLKPVRILTLPIYSAIPVATGVAILRYRLWDIDVLIRRTLLYALLSLLLGAVYLGGVTIIGGVLRGATGSTSQLAVVASTLLVAALFQPLRLRIQSVIDRRFYRRKYDTAATVAAFGARLRDEVALHRLSDELVDVVNDALQPTHASLWLRPAGDQIEKHAASRSIATPP